MSSQPQRGDGRAHEQSNVDSAEQCSQQSSQSQHAASQTWYTASEESQANEVFNTRDSHNDVQQDGGQEGGSSGLGGQLDDGQEITSNESSSSQTATPTIPSSFTTAEDVSICQQVRSDFTGSQTSQPAINAQLSQAKEDLNRALGQLASIPSQQLPSIISQLLVFSHTLQDLFQEAEHVSTTEKLAVAAMSYQAAGKIVDGMREQWEKAVARLDPLALGSGPYSINDLATIERALVENNLASLLAKPAPQRDNADVAQSSSHSISVDDASSTTTLRPTRNLTQSALIARVQRFDEAMTRAWQMADSYVPSFLGQTRYNPGRRDRSD